VHHLEPVGYVEPACGKETNSQQGETAENQRDSEATKKRQTLQRPKVWCHTLVVLPDSFAWPQEVAPAAQQAVEVQQAWLNSWIFRPTWSNFGMPKKCSESDIDVLRVEMTIQPFSLL
jgi:hypothetical protein